MGAQEFQSLFYAGGIPEEGDPDGDGLQFQAVSPRTTGQAMAAVGQLRFAATPTGDGQPMLAHWYDGVYVTAQCAASGQPRFVHAIAAADAQLYGEVRPAQLWRAQWWADSPDEVCAAVAARPESGPLHPELLRDWVLENPRGQEWLTAILSAVQRAQAPDAPRVVFVSAAVEPVIRWIAAATLLLPQQTALRTSFQVLSDDPLRSPHRLVAVHPDAAGELTGVEDIAGVCVFDLESGEFQTTVLTEAARHWVPRFLNGDPQRIVQAVELAHRFARERGAVAATAADRLASCTVVLGESPADPEDVRTLAGWVTEQIKHSGARTVQPVLDAVVGGSPGLSILAELAAGLTGDQAAQARIALLRNELDAGAPTGQVTKSWDWTAEELYEATAVVEQACRAAAGSQLDGVLRIASQYGVTPRFEEFRESAERFVFWWADNPDARVHPEEWVCRDELLRLLREELNRRLAAGATATADLEQHWWPLLVPALSDPSSELDATVAGAAMAAGGQARRDAVAVLCRRLRASGTRERAERIWQVLFSSVDPTVEELSEFFGSLPTTWISESLAHRAFQVLSKSTVSARYLDVLRLLGHHLDAGHGWLRQLWEEDSRMRSWLTSLRRAKTFPENLQLQGISEHVLQARAEEAVQQLLGVSLSAAAVVSSGAQLQRMLVRELPKTWLDGSAEEQRQHRAVALAFLIAWSDDSATEVKAGFDQALEAWARSHTQADYREVSRLLREAGADVSAWHEWLRELYRGQTRPKRSRIAEWLAHWMRRSQQPR